jgi:Lectin C-type domain
VTGQPRLRLVSIGAIATLAACLPLDDLSGYSSAPVGPFAGGNGSGASGGSTSGSASSGAPAAAGTGNGQSGEGSGGALSLDPSGMAGGAGAGDQGSGGSVGAADAGSCDGPDEFAGADARGCYLLTADTATWLDARAACVRWGGDLVRIESAAEDDSLNARLTIDVWIGANDREIEGTMVWADGSPLLYSNWGDAQPDDFNAQEDCGEKRVADAGGWNDSPCDGTPRAFLCER